MKKILVILFLLQSLLFSKEEVNIVNRFKQGPFIDTQDGNIEKGTYVNNLKNGEYTLEIPEIKLVLKGTYENGYLNGVEKIYKDNEFIGEITYFHNQILGYQVENIEELVRSGYMGMNKNGYFEMKTPDSVISYKQEDELVNGQLVINKNNGDKIYLTYFEGIPLGDVKFVSKDGEVKYYEYLYDIKGITLSEEKFLENIYTYLGDEEVKKENNLKQGPVKLSIRDAIIEYTYVNNELNGPVRLVFPTIVKEINFVNGKREGKSVYRTGELKEIRNYKNDLLDGETIIGNQTLVYNEGKVVKIINHIDDITTITTNFVDEKPVGDIVITEGENKKIVATYNENHILVFDGKQYAKNDDIVEFYESLKNPLFIIVTKNNGEKRQYKSLNDYLEDKEYVIIQK